MLYKLLAVLLTAYLLPAFGAMACSVCRPKVKAAIYTPYHSTTALLLLLPVTLLVGGALLLFFSPNLSRWHLTPRPSTARP